MLYPFAYNNTTDDVFLMLILMLLCLSYLAGSLPTGKLLGRWRGIDIQRHGSGNIGFANAVRVLGWRLGLVVLTVDCTKGLLPTIVALQLAPHWAWAIGLAAILGHIVPVWLGFKGGKGIATGLGVLLALQPIVAAAAVAVYVLCMAIVRNAGLASLAGTWSLLLWTPLFAPTLWWLAICFGAIATATHRHNIRRMLHKMRSTS